MQDCESTFGGAIRVIKISIKTQKEVTHTIFINEKSDYPVCVLSELKNGALNGIKFVAIALITSSAIILFADVLFPYTYADGNISVAPNLDYIKIFVLIIAGYFLLKLLFKRKPSPIIVIILSALIGLAYFYI